ncbi:MULTISPECIES: DUF2283 domain-containing protein [unclassified Microcoleus]|uniref:DUF2283 domain-containing protein n=1 Tax=unclassified Microcoleus TaxID=2642155 RepID=UPI002FD62723
MDIELLPLAPGTAENRELTEDIIADCSPNGKLAGLEILDASQILGEEDTAERGHSSALSLPNSSIDLLGW